MLANRFVRQRSTSPIGLWLLLVTLFIVPLWLSHSVLSQVALADQSNGSAVLVDVPEKGHQSQSEAQFKAQSEVLNASDGTSDTSEEPAAVPVRDDGQKASEASKGSLPTRQGSDVYCVFLPLLTGGSGTSTHSQVPVPELVEGQEPGAGSNCTTSDQPIGPATILRSSPLNGEDGVAVTRETIIDFSHPIDPNSVSDAAISAQFGGNTLATRLHISPDNRTVTLFYNEPLPASARVRVTIDGEQLFDADGNPVDVDGDGSAGGSTTIDFDTLSLTVIEGTSVCGRVFASELDTSDRGTSVNVPLQGVTITVDGMENTLRTTTDNKGNFCLDPAPAGRFFVHIDGRTATNGVPEGTYYPFVGKAWESVPSQQTNVGNVHLPLVPAGTLQAVSETEDTTINLAPSVLEQFPEFADVSITVPADSLYADDGTRGGMVGIAPVPPDRLPGQLPEGLNFPVVITVQTDGATNFDQPAPVCFPNLPDPDTGETLAAGEKGALWSFNHDTGRFEPVGPMTVSQDGELVCTDLGVGVRAPGWHGFNPSSWLNGLKRLNPQCNPSDPTGCASSAFAGLFDCVLSFTPVKPLGCAFSLMTGGISTARDCVGNPGERSCHITAASAAGAAGAECLTSIPGLGQAITCGGAIAGAATACNCSLRRSPSQDALTNFEAHLEILEAQQNFNEVLFGSSVWLTVADESGDPRITEEQIQRIIDQSMAASDASSDGAQLITEAEATLIRSLERPTKLSESDVNALIDYWNRTTELWRQGITTHAQAGRTDFMDEDQYLEALDQIEMSVGQLEATDATEINFQESIFDFRDTFAAPDPISFPDSQVYYALQDETNGFIQRGQLTGSGDLQVTGVSPNTFYRLMLFEPATFGYGSIPFTSSQAGVATEIPDSVVFSCSNNIDTDNDGLPDVAEFVMGTDPNNPDTDNDGIPDGAEVQQGTNPLDGLPAATGIIASADTPGTAVDVCVSQESAIIADSEAGVSVFNVFNGMNPSIIAQVDTPGNAQAVACAGNLLAVADGESGLAVIDIADPPAAQIVHQVDVSGTAQAVTVVGNVAYVGTAPNQLVAVDLANGVVLGEVALSDQALDIALWHDYLYVLTDDDTLHVMTWRDGLSVLGSTTSPSPSGSNRRLFVGGGIAYAAHNRGVNTFDLVNPTQPALIAEGNTTQLGWRQLVANGAGLGIAAVGVNSSSSRNVLLYDVSDPTQTDVFLTQFDTPGSATSIAINNGLAYVADRSAGLQVINYLAYDAQGVEPTLTLASNFAPGVAEEDALMRVTANATDDVQIRSVEYDVDGVRQFTDGNFPFEYRFTTPRIAEQSTFTLTVRAIDTGGNDTQVEQLITLQPDATAPRVTSVTPERNVLAEAGAINALTATFNEPIDPATLTETTFQLFTFGADGIPANEDDVPVTGGTISYHADTNTVSLNYDTPLPADRYRAVVAPPLADLPGNPLAAEWAWTFELVPFIQIGDVISGEISVAGQIDTYFFSAEAGQQVYFDAQGTSASFTEVEWRLLDPQGSEIFNQRNFSDAGAYTLETGGTYTLLVFGEEDTTSTYQFQLWNVPPPDEFTINIGDVVSDGNPAAGAGNIETPGVTDIYYFEATAGQQLYFDAQGTSAFFTEVEWRLLDPQGSEIFNQRNFSDAGAYTLETGGTYTLLVFGEEDTTSTYQFQLWNVPPPDEFTINIGDVVSDGNPAAGAGNIETPGVTDIYYFEATAGQQLYFDAQGTSASFTEVEWRLLDPQGSEIFNQRNFSDAGAYTLETGGTYTLLVLGEGDTTSTYSFQIIDQSQMRTPNSSVPISR